MAGSFTIRQSKRIMGAGPSPDVIAFRYDDGEGVAAIDEAG